MPTALHRQAAADPAAWWARQARALHWFKRPTETLDETDAPFYRWFADGTLNASFNCLDRHVYSGLGGRVAFHWHGECGERCPIGPGDVWLDDALAAAAPHHDTIDVLRRRVTAP